MALAQRKVSEEELAFQEEIDAWQKLATPGEPHRRLAGRAGRWSTQSKHWMELDKPPVESAGSCERKMILGGRFLQEEFNGDLMGNPFTGIGITGYDNQSNKYVMSWVDTLSTGIYRFEGTASEDGKTITVEGRFKHPVKGLGTWRGVTRFVDDRTEVAEMHGTYENGAEERCVTTYTRKS
ncbi:MAG: DUF1579 domain-containing protein [Thermodesulfobacteriota bacterium]